MSSVPPLSDVDLVIGLANGDRAALGALYDRFSGVLMAIGMQRLNDREEAEEVLHDVFIEVWRAADDYDPDRGSVRAWLVMRMRSRVLDRCRSPGRLRRVALDPGAARDPDAASRFSYETDPTASEDARRVRAAMASLPADQRRVLELGYFEGLASIEIATRLDIPVGTVKSRVAAAMEKLRKELLSR